MSGETAIATANDLLRVEDLHIRSRLGGRERRIVTSLSLSVGRGETIGIVGESGSGKSLTARAIMGLLPDGLHASGRVEYGGRNLLEARERELAGLRGTEIGLVFQDPFTMLSPLRRCHRHIDELLRGPSGRRLGRRERRAEAVRRLAEVGIDDPSVADRYPFQLSGGMRQRVGIAAALARDPKLLIADEPSTALDVTTQREILALLKSLQRSRGMGLIMITHDLRVAFGMCDRIYVLYAGSLLELAPAAAIEEEPRHPYTLGLLLSEPSAERRAAELRPIRGSVPDADDVVGQCAFAPRCDWATDACVAAAAPLRPLPEGGLSACIRAVEIRDQMLERLREARADAPVAVARRAGEPLLRCTDVRKAFGTGERQVRALAGVSIEVGAGESVGLVGESGSGKTTLGRCVVGLETPTSGSIVLGGISAAGEGRPSASDRAVLRQTAQIVFQDPYSSLNPVRPIGSALREALAVGAPRSRRVDAQVRELLARVGLPADYAARKPVALSGGERQRVAIARALAVRPKLLVCDEPVSALDVSVQAQILNLFGRLREEEGLALLFITHDLAVARQVVDRAYVLYRGEVVEHGPVDQILDRPAHAYTQRLVDSIPRSGGGWIVGSGDVAAGVLGRALPLG
jgi:peptide/nickel transport system ATP-binding protein